MTKTTGLWLARGCMLLAIASCATPDADHASSASSQVGAASYYGQRFAGRPTASGERFDPAALTAAHRSLPFGTSVRVTNLANNRSVVVRINDRGPHVKGRILDLSSGAFARIAALEQGVVQVRVHILGPPAQES